MLLYCRKIVRTILYSSERVTGESSEAMWFLFVLLLCSLTASGYVMWHNYYKVGEGQRRSRYKLLLNCIMIITSVVPPEFPVSVPFP